MDSNIIVDIFRKFQMLTKFGTLDPLFIAEILQRIQENTKSFWKYYLYTSQDFGHPKFQFFGKGWCRTFRRAMFRIPMGPKEMVLTIVLKEKKNRKQHGGILVKSLRS